jgi:hypothetical protein
MRLTRSPQRRRQGTAAVRRQRLRHQIPARPAKPAHTARLSSGESPPLPPATARPPPRRRRERSEKLARRIHHAPQIEREVR